MEAPKRIFIDSDVIPSSALANGYSYSLFKLDWRLFRLFVSGHSKIEVRSRAKQLYISPLVVLQRFSRCSTVYCQEQTLQEVHQRYKQYVFDPSDTHVIAGAHLSAEYLITRNFKDFDAPKIHAELGITVLRPEEFMALLRKRSVAA